MLTYSLPSTKIYRIGRTEYDDGSAADPWELPDWRYAPFSGRFADPEPDPRYRIRYVALTPYGSYVEALQKYRPDLTVLGAVAAVTQNRPRPGSSDPGRLLREERARKCRFGSARRPRSDRPRQRRGYGSSTWRDYGGLPRVRHPVDGLRCVDAAFSHLTNVHPVIVACRF